MSAGSGTARMLRLIGLIGVVATVLAGCTWQQAYYAGQQWQRNACNRLIEQAERDRCLSNANMPYDDYLRQIDRPKKDQDPSRERQ
jgi:hypothetical protein